VFCANLRKPFEHVTCPVCCVDASACLQIHARGQPAARPAYCWCRRRLCFLSPPTTTTTTTTTMSSLVGVPGRFMRFSDR